MDAADALLREVAAAHAGDHAELEAAILERLRATLPEFFADTDVAYDMQAAVAANVARFQRVLARTPEAAVDRAVPVEAVDLLASTIQHGIPLISLLEAYRAAQGLAGEWWQERIERGRPAAQRGPAARTLNRLLVSYIDGAAAEIRSAYEHERRAQESSAEARRALLIRKLLAGEPLDPDAAARTLNHPLTARHVGVVVWRSTEDVGVEALGAALATVAAACGEVRTLTSPARHRMYAWLSAHGRIDPGAACAVALPAGVQVALSSVHVGVRGFVDAHQEAARTAAAVRDRPTGAQVHVYEALELVALLARDRGACDAFVRRALGRLAADDPGAERSRQTLQAYLATGSSPSRTAERLGVHRNTVAYRLQGLADVAAVDDPAWQATRRLEVELALRVVEQIGPPGQTTRP